MIDAPYLTFVMRNPAHTTKHWRHIWSTRKAMLEYRKTHTTCELTGDSKGLHLHHRLPVSVRPDLAGEPSNFQMLRKDVHWLMHGGRSWKSFVKPSAVAAIIIIYTSNLVQTTAYEYKHDA